MWNHDSDPPRTIYDALEPVVSIILVIAVLAIIPFTPLSPFQGREMSVLDQMAGVNLAAGARSSGSYPPVATRQTEVRIRQADLPVKTQTIAR